MVCLGCVFVKMTDLEENSKIDYFTKCDNGPFKFKARFGGKQTQWSG